MIRAFETAEIIFQRGIGCMQHVLTVEFVKEKEPCDRERDAGLEICYTAHSEAACCPAWPLEIGLTTRDQDN
jgi:hypothetical protein